MDDIQRKLNVLRRSEIFLGLPNEALVEIINQVTCHIKTYEANKVLFNIGDMARELFIMEDGRIDLVLTYLSPDPKSQVKAIVDTIYTGGTFGWSALIAPYTYTIGASCVEPAKVLAINGSELLRLMDKDIPIGYEVMKALTRVIGLRLRDSNRALIKIIARNNSVP